MNKLRVKFERMAWAQIHSRPVPSGVLADHYGLAKSGRAASFLELEQALRDGGDWDIEFPQFLDEFYLFRNVQFFEVEPSDYFDQRTRAWFAAIVEWLCHEFIVPVPPWAERQEFFLNEYWRMMEGSGDPEFLRRNIGYNPHRCLIRL